MAATKLNLKIEQGATYIGPGSGGNATLKNGSPPVPTDLTACTARMQVRRAVDDPEVLLSLTTENGGIVLGGTAGTITLGLTAVQTAAIQWTAGVYDLEMIYSTGLVRRLLAGTVTVSREVTR